MKIRNGFVSNSSSSSYIIDAKAYPSVFALALEMLKIRNKDNKDNDFKPSMVALNRIKKSKLDVNTPIAFNTCNYDTYIVKAGECYLVQTCENHPFSQLNGQINRNTPIPKEVYIALGLDKQDILKIENIWEIAQYELSAKFFFWWPEYNIKGKSLGYDDKKFCKKHYRHFDLLEDGTEECLACYAEKIK